MSSLRDLIEDLSERVARLEKNGSTGPKPGTRQYYAPFTQEQSDALELAVSELESDKETDLTMSTLIDKAADFCDDFPTRSSHTSERVLRWFAQYRGMVIRWARPEKPGGRQ